MNLKEKILLKNQIYKGKHINFFADTIILPNNREALREYTDHPGAVAILPFLDERNIILVKQYRYPVGKITYEIPAGKLDRKESPIDCAIRELKEETGFSAKKFFF